MTFGLLVSLSCSYAYTGVNCSVGDTHISHSKTLNNLSSLKEYTCKSNTKQNLVLIFQTVNKFSDQSFVWYKTSLG